MTNKNEKIPRLAICSLERSCDIGSLRHEIYLKILDLKESDSNLNPSSDKENFKGTLTEIGADKHRFLRTLFNNLASGKEILLKSAEEEEQKGRSSSDSTPPEKKITPISTLTQKLEETMHTPLVGETCDKLTEAAEKFNLTMHHIEEGGSDKSSLFEELGADDYREDIVKHLENLFSDNPKNDESGVTSMFSEEFESKTQDFMKTLMEEVENECLSDDALDEIIDDVIEEENLKSGQKSAPTDGKDTPSETNDEASAEEIEKLLTIEMEKNLKEGLNDWVEDFEQAAKSLESDNPSQEDEKNEETKEISEAYLKEVILNLSKSKDLPGSQMIADLLQNALLSSDKGWSEIDVLKTINEIKGSDKILDAHMNLLEKEESHTSPSQESISEAVKSMETIKNNLSSFHDTQNIEIVKKAESSKEVQKLLKDFTPVFDSLGLEINSLDDVIHSYEELIDSFVNSKDQISPKNQNLFEQVIDESGLGNSHVVQALESLEKTFQDSQKPANLLKDCELPSDKKDSSEETIDLKRLLRDLQDKKKPMFYIELSEEILDKKEKILEILNATELGGIREQAHYLLFLRRLRRFTLSNQSHCPITHEESIALQVALEMNSNLPMYFRTTPGI